MTVALWFVVPDHQIIASLFFLVPSVIDFFAIFPLDIITYDNTSTLHSVCCLPVDGLLLISVTKIVQSVSLPS